MIKQKCLIISDLNDSFFIEKIREKYPESIILSPQNPIKPCIGCLSCWLKTPGKCVIDDDYSHMGKEISECTDMIFISKCTYGGFSPFVKNVIDRSISYMLPLFRKKGKNSYHYRRYPNIIRCSAYFYGENITDEEKRTAIKLCNANAALWDCSDYEVKFFDNNNKNVWWIE